MIATDTSTAAANAADPVGTRDELTFVELLNVVLRHRRNIAVLALVLAVLTGLWSLSRPREYAASASFVPQTNDMGASGALALARQFGIGGATDASGYSPQFYAQLIETRRIVRSVLTMPLPAVVDGVSTDVTLIELYGLSDAPPGRMWMEAEQELRESISVAVTAETGVIEMSVATLDPNLSEHIAARVLALVGEFNVETRRRQALEETRFVSERLLEVTDSLHSTERSLMSFLERNRFFDSPALTFEHDRLQRQVIHQQTLYSSLVESLERARLEAARDLPVLTIINNPVGSAVPRARRTVLKVIVSLIAGLIIGVFLAFLREHFRRETAMNRSAGNEFRALTREALADVRRPFRFFETGSVADRK